jgi:hypothetical protein
MRIHDGEESEKTSWQINQSLWLICQLVFMHDISGSAQTSIKDILPFSQIAAAVIE